MPAENQRALTVRFDAMTYDMVQAEATHAGVSVAQFIREATVMRCSIRAVRRSAPSVAMDFAVLAEEVERRSAIRRRRR